MPCCAAVNCKAKPIPKYLNDEKENEKKITFHNPSKSSTLCSQHFEEEYISRVGGNVTLRKGAIPTIFDYPAHLLDHIIYCKPEPELEPPCSPASDTFSDHSYDFTDVESAKKKYEADIEILKAKLAVSQEKARKFQRRAQQLEKELKSLHNKDSVTEPTVKILSKSRQIVKVPVKIMDI